MDREEDRNRMKYLELKNIVKTYHYANRKGLKVVLDGVSFRVNYGDRVGILGLNGSGKSTLIKIIGGVIGIDSGEVIRKMSVSWPIAFSGGFQGSLTGFDNLRFICRAYGTSWEDKVEKVQEIAELGEYFYEPVKSYSSGMRARLAFALSAVIEFDCYLIDEVIAVGDQRFKNKCLHELFEKRAERSYIIVSHQPGYIKEYCNRFMVLNSGKLIEFGNFEDAWKFYTSL